MTALPPAVFLVWLITKRRALSAGVALPLAALLIYFIQLIYFKLGMNVLHTAVLDGLLIALTPTPSQEDRVNLNYDFGYHWDTITASIRCISVLDFQKKFIGTT